MNSPNFFLYSIALTLAVVQHTHNTSGGHRSATVSKLTYTVHCIHRALLPYWRKAKTHFTCVPCGKTVNLPRIFSLLSKVYSLLCLVTTTTRLLPLYALCVKSMKYSMKKSPYGKPSPTLLGQNLFVYFINVFTVLLSLLDQHVSYGLLAPKDNL